MHDKLLCNQFHSMTVEPLYSFIQAIFLNLLFKSLKSDPETNRVKAFLKRMLQVCSNHAPPFVCGSLFLISEVCGYVLYL